MYNLPYFTGHDEQKVIAFMKEFPFAIVSGNTNEYPVATHLPLNIIQQENGSIMLTGHLMKNTDHHKAFLQNNNVLVIFNGPNTYVSASWYSKPSGSTWNYMTVHAKGKIKFLDEAGTYKAVKDITEKYEGLNSTASFSKLTNEYIQSMLQAIVGFEIEVEHINNVFKLSQNHDEETRVHISSQLLKRNDPQSTAIANGIRKMLENE